jgi:hypothetical protein
LKQYADAFGNPRDRVKIVPEAVPGYPDRILPINAGAEKELKKRVVS